MTIFCSECKYLLKQYSKGYVENLCLNDPDYINTPLKQTTVYSRCERKNLYNNCKEFKPAKWWYVSKWWNRFA